MRIIQDSLDDALCDVLSVIAFAYFEGWVHG